MQFTGPLTGRGVTVLGAAGASFVAGVFAGYPLFRVLGGLGLGALLAAVALTGRRPRVTVRRDLYPDRVEVGRPALATLRVRNTGDRAEAAFVAHDSAGKARRQVSIRRLAPGSETTYRYEVPTVRRGRLQVGPLSLERTDPLGLARTRATTGEVATLWVHPRRHPVRTAVAGRPRHHHVGRTADTSLRGSTDLRDVRPYVVGDEVRHLHWKATARAGQLMVRDYVDPDQPRLSLVLDTRAGALSGAAFEEAVEVAASILFAATMAGHRCRLLMPSGADLATAGGPHAARVLLDALCETEQAPGSDLPLVPVALTETRSGGGAMVVVTGPSAQAREVLPLLTRYRPVTVFSLGSGSESMRGLLHIAATDAAGALRQWNGLTG